MFLWRNILHSPRAIKLKYSLIVFALIFFHSHFLSFHHICYYESHHLCIVADSPDFHFLRLNFSAGLFQGEVTLPVCLRTDIAILGFMQHLWNLKGRKRPPYWETRSCLFLLIDCIHLRWFRSSCFESWQIRPAVGLLGSLLRSHTLVFNIKRLTESTLNYLFFSFTTVDTSDPHHSCRSRSNTLCFSLSFSRFLHIHILAHRNAHSHVIYCTRKNTYQRGGVHTCIYTNTHL